MLNDASRRARSLELLADRAPFISAAHFGITDPFAYKNPDQVLKTLSQEQKDDLHWLDQRKQRQLEILRGNGMHFSITRLPAFPPSYAADHMDIQLATPGTEFRNFTTGLNNLFIDAVINVSLEADRKAFERCLQYVPWGIGIVLAPPGFSKTTSGAQVALVMRQRFGRILCSGPTHVAIQNFANRLENVNNSVLEVVNMGKAPEERLPPYFIVRAYAYNAEFHALEYMLQHPQTLRLGDDGITRGSRWHPESNWQRNLSLTQWLLALLGGGNLGGRYVRDSDCKALRDLKTLIDCDTRRSVKNMRALARGQLDWDKYSTLPKSEQFSEADVHGIFDRIIGLADFLCATPSFCASAGSDFRGNASGMVIEEAGCMHRGDLLSVWGNCFMPLFLFGDPKQLPPTVISEHETKDGYPVNRFVADGKTSVLEAFLIYGFPAYQLNTQLRMGKGLFDWVANVFYPEVPVAYSQKCEVELDSFAIGRDLDKFFVDRGVESSPKGLLYPVFIHCKGAQVFVDRETKSKHSPDQVKIALDLIMEFLKTYPCTLRPSLTSKISVLSPYKANVKTIKKLLREPQYEMLKAMPTPCTVDSYQGHENDIICLIMGTAAVKPGPGFTSNPKRLNVMLTRMRAGMFVVGDINVAGNFSGKPKNRLRPGMMKVRNDDGTVTVRKSPKELLAIHKRFSESGRVYEIEVRE